jgi:hypothetical protein
VYYFIHLAAICLPACLPAYQPICFTAYIRPVGAGGGPSRF